MIQKRKARTFCQNQTKSGRGSSVSHKEELYKTIERQKAKKPKQKSRKRPSVLRKSIREKN